MDTTGLEPVTPTMSTWCSNQLSYASEQLLRIARILRHAQINFVGDAETQKAVTIKAEVLRVARICSLDAQGSPCQRC
jgi:hypothetical protein